MYFFLVSLMVILILVIAMMLQRLFQGPSVYDRMNGLGVVTANTILLIVIFVYIDERTDMYVDIAMAFAMLGCVASIILAKYLGG